MNGCGDRLFNIFFWRDTSSMYLCRTSFVSSICKLLHTRRGPIPATSRSLVSRLLWQHPVLLRPALRSLSTSVCAISSASMSVPVNANGTAPAQDFFRDVVYVNALATGTPVPWDIKAPQPALATVSQHLRGAVLDMGAGLGDNAIWVGSLPGVTSVTAVDVSPEAVAEARKRLASASQPPKAPVSFLVGDVFALAPLLGEQRFDTLLDSAVFHCIGDDATQARYLAAVTPYVKTGGTVVMCVFSDQNPDPWRGPRRINADQAREQWSGAGWRVESMATDVFYKDIIREKDAHALLMVATKL
jgi:SAM-dependent methyltransferase